MIHLLAYHILFSCSKESDTDPDSTDSGDSVEAGSGEMIYYVGEEKRTAISASSITISSVPNTGSKNFTLSATDNIKGEHMVVVNVYFEFLQEQIVDPRNSK